MARSAPHPTDAHAIILRPAIPADCRRIAELFRIASDGVVEYVWHQLQGDHPGLSPLRPRRSLPHRL